MKKIVATIALVLVTASAYAQFEYDDFFGCLNLESFKVGDYTFEVDHNTFKVSEYKYGPTPAQRYYKMGGGKYYYHCESSKEAKKLNYFIFSNKRSLEEKFSVTIPCVTYYGVLVILTVYDTDTYNKYKEEERHAKEYVEPEVEKRLASLSRVLE